MKLRYRMSGDLYIPQYYIPSEDKWEDFKVKNIPKSLRSLCESIGTLQLPSRWSNGQWYYNPNKGSKEEDMSLIFTKEMYVMAFLGAAKSVFSEQVKEFNL